jgi:hypothetical protein
MKQMLDFIKNNGGSVLLLLALVVALYLGFNQLIGLGNSQTTVMSLPLLAIGGVILLILALTIVALIFSLLNINDKTQAMGLPDGSIRAVIALSLIVLFAILSVYLYEGANGELNTIQNLSDMDRVRFIQDHPTARDLQSVPVKDKSGKPTSLYNVTYRSATNTTREDFAKQLLVLLGTLMTAITSFYLGAGTATSAAAAAQPDSTPPPTVSSIDPTSYSLSNRGPVIQLKIMGNNLNIITHAKIVKAGVPVIGTNVQSNPTQVTCSIAVNAAIMVPGSTWDVVVDDGASKSATLPAALTINA